MDQDDVDYLRQTATRFAPKIGLDPSQGELLTEMMLLWGWAIYAEHPEESVGRWLELRKQLQLNAEQLRAMVRYLRSDVQDIANADSACWRQRSSSHVAASSAGLASAPMIA